MKDSIAKAAAAVLLRDGLQRWSVDRVAAEAGCAKGLVPYHHGSKTKLLARVAADLYASRIEARLMALDGSGAEALDRLWEILLHEVQSGAWAAWAALVAEPSIPSPLHSRDSLAKFAGAIEGALGIPPLSPEDTVLSAAALDGFQVALHLGSPPESVHEAYHRLWLWLLP